MKRLAATSALVFATACGGGTTSRGGPGSGDSARRAESGARQGSDVDLLWSYAPADTAIGIVVAPGTTLKLYDTAEEIVRVIEARSLGANAMKEARSELSELPFNVFDRNAFGPAGIDLGLGAALFMDSAENMTIVLPVKDRKAFRTLAEGEELQANGLSIDKLDDDVFCTDARAHYVCAQTTEKLLEVAKGRGSSFAERVYSLPASYRGDAELVMDIDAFEKMEGEKDAELREIVSDPGLLAAVVQLGNGSMTARLWLQGELRGDMKTVVDASAHVGALSDQIASMKPSSLLRMIMPIALVEKEVQDETLPGGYSLKRDILGKMTGEIVAFTPSSSKPWGRLAIGITDAAAFRSLLDMGCSMIPLMPMLEVTEKSGGRCDLVIDWDQVPNLDPEARVLFSGKMRAEAAVNDSQLSLTIGHESPIDDSAQASEIGRELLEQEWSYSLWAQNLSLITSLDEPWAKVIGGQPAEMQEGMRYALWLVAHISEFAAAMSLQSDGMHFMAHIGTYAADPVEPYEAYQAAVMKNIDVGDSTREFADIRKRWPTSLAARQSAVASPFSVIFSKVIAAISLPAFVKYMEASREAGADFDPEMSN